MKSMKIKITNIILAAFFCLNSLAQGDAVAPKYMLMLGAYRGADFFNVHGSNEMFSAFTGLYSHMKWKKFSLITDMTYMDRMIDDQQIIKPFFNNTYRLSIGNAICFTVGYSDNRWVSQAASPIHDLTTTISDGQGKSYQLLNPLITYSAPSYILGYNFMTSRIQSSGNTELILDEYDKSHEKKFRSTWLICGTIDLMYAPQIKTETDILYSPYGYYVPRKLHVSMPVKERKFGVHMKMVVNTPYLFGFYMAIGLLPSAFSTEIDNKINVNARAGIMLNFSRAKE